MSVFSSKFDLVTEESFAAPGAVAVMLDVGRSSSFDANGTPVKGSFTAGSIVKIGAGGKAELASSPTLFTQDAVSKAITFVAPVVPLVVIDGTDTFSGAFTSKVTCLAHGFQMKTDQYEPGTYTIGAPVSFNVGKVCVWESGKQVLGFVGKDGLVDGKLHVLVVKA